LAVCHS